VPTIETNLLKSEA